VYSFECTKIPSRRLFLHNVIPVHFCIQGHSFTNLIQGHYCVSGHSWTYVCPNHLCTTSSDNNHFALMWCEVPLLCNSRFQQWELFGHIVTQQRVPSMGPTVAQLELDHPIVAQQWGLPPQAGVHPTSQVRSSVMFG
jgi:hypothetical protein